MAKKWCEHQTKCVEDTEETFTCTAHMAEARAFQCPYKNTADRVSRKYPCPDFVAE